LNAKRIRLTKHARERLLRRSISLDAVINTVEEPDHRLYDIKEDTIIYVSEKNRLIVVTAPSTVGEVRVVTVIPCTKIRELVERRVKSGRWIPLA
jgi:hypothetical protein